MREAIEFDMYIIYLDETSFTREEGRNYGYGKIGQPVVFEKYKPTFSIGCLCAISKFRLEGIVLRAGTTNKLVFINFVLNLMHTLSLQPTVNLSRVVFYLDNATYHSSEDVLKLFKLLRVNFIFAPAYLSPLNPIEYFFGVIKSKLKHHDIIKK